MAAVISFDQDANAYYSALDDHEGVVTLTTQVTDNALFDYAGEVSKFFAKTS